MLAVLLYPHDAVAQSDKSFPQRPVRMVVPFPAVIISSIVGLLAGSLLYFLLSRFLGARTNLVFTIISVVFLLIATMSPINAMSQETVPGLGTFNMATMIATQIMHLVVGGFAVVRLRGLMQ